MSKRALNTDGDTGMGKPAKRRRVDVTACQKKQICEYKRDHTRASLSEVQQCASSKLKLDIGKSTVGDIVRSSVKWLDVSADGCDATRVLQIFFMLQ